MGTVFMSVASSVVHTHYTKMCHEALFRNQPKDYCSANFMTKHDGVMGDVASLMVFAGHMVALDVLPISQPGHVWMATFANDIHLADYVASAHAALNERIDDSEVMAPALTDWLPASASLSPDMKTLHFVTCWTFGSKTSAGGCRSNSSPVAGAGCIRGAVHCMHEIDVQTADIVERGDRIMVIVCVMATSRAAALIARRRDAGWWTGLHGFCKGQQFPSLGSVFSGAQSVPARNCADGGVLVL